MGQGHPVGRHGPTGDTSVESGGKGLVKHLTQGRLLLADCAWGAI